MTNLIQEKKEATTRTVTKKEPPKEASRGKQAGRQDTGIGHVGLRATNLATSAEFYRDIFGMEIAGGSPSDHPFGATAFLSCRPDQESHEIALFANPVFAHIAFKVSSLAELRSFHARVVEKKIPIKAVFNHHESFAFYFDDPGGNMIEVYWLTGDLSWRQPYAEPLDLVAARRAAREDNGHALTGNDA
jgi:catechol-2,3-dioxygenase